MGGLLVKTLVKSVLRAGVAHLPAGAREAILDGVASSLGPWSVVHRIASECGVTSIGVAGAYGPIVGSVSDADVLPTYARTGQFAKRTNNLLSKFFDGRSGLYVDVGANIGLTTIPVAQNHQVRCVAIEPAPMNFANLTANVAVNCPGHNVELHHVALFSRKGVLRLELSPDNAGDNRLRLNSASGELAEEHWTIVEVEAAPLDDIVRDVRGPMAAKIDVQGAEPFVFEGGNRTLAHADLIIVEWAPYLLTRVGGNPRVVTSFLSENFDFLSVAEGEEGPASAPEPAPLVAERLLTMARDHRDDPRRYGDVIAYRDHAAERLLRRSD